MCAGRFEGLQPARAVTAFRLEGVKPSVKHRTDVLAALLKPFGAVEVIAEKQSRALWRGIRDAAPFAATGDGHDRPLWRVSTAAGQGLRIVRDDLARRADVLRLGRGTDLDPDAAGG